MLKALRFGLVYKVYPELKAFRDMSHYWRLWNIVNMIPSRLNLPRSGLSVEIGGIKVRTSRIGWNYKIVKRKILQSAVWMCWRQEKWKSTAGPSQQARFEATSTSSAGNNDVQPSFPKFIIRCLTYYTNSKSKTQNKNRKNSLNKIILK